MDISTIASQQMTASTSAFSSLTNNIDTFLTLLTTQLRNQDPLEPLDTEKFTEQLVQFASVEQSIKTNSHLEALIALQATSERDSALGLLGRTATLASDKASFTDGAATWSYKLPSQASVVTLSIIDEGGALIARRPGAVHAGIHEVAWDGLNDSGARVTDGVFRLIVDAQGPDGSPIAADIETSAVVTGVTFGNLEPSLETSAGAVSLSTVRRVSAIKS